MAKKLEAREADLRVFVALGRHLLQTDDLHYGCWPDGLEVSIRNLPQAQENHSQLIISHIPKGTKTILDVGCGVGALARRLKALGYAVEGVTPSAYLAEEARRSHGGDFHVHVSRIEDLATDRRYDLVLFSESFQYVKMETAIPKCLSLLNPGGHLLICDFFRTEAEGAGPLAGGLRITRFCEIIAGVPFRLVTDIDITKETAPTMDLADSGLRNVVKPLWELLQQGIESKSRLGYRFLMWTFRKRIAKMEKRYFCGAWSGEQFRRLKTYRLLLYARTA